MLLAVHPFDRMGARLMTSAPAAGAVMSSMRMGHGLRTPPSVPAHCALLLLKVLSGSLLVGRTGRSRQVVSWLELIGLAFATCCCPR